MPYLRQKKYKKYRREYGKYLCRTWNGFDYKEDDQDMGQLLTFQLKFYHEPLICEDDVDERGEQTGVCREMMGAWTLWTHSCF